MLKKLYEKFRAWTAARAAKKELEDFERGRRWAHEEITYGRGYEYVEKMTYGAWDAFDRGAHKALEQHALMQQMLGRTFRRNVQVDAEFAEKLQRDLDACREIHFDAGGRRSSVERPPMDPDELAAFARTMGAEVRGTYVDPSTGQAYTHIVERTPSTKDVPAPQALHWPPVDDE